MTDRDTSAREIVIVTMTAAVLATVIIALQFPGFLSATMFPTEPDVLALEAFGRRWFFSHWSTISPSTALGVPLLATPTTGLATPVTWLAAWLPWARAMAIGWALHAALFASGWAVALRRLGAPVAAAVGAGTLMLATGPVWSFHAVATVDMASVAWTGWVTVAAHRWCVTRRTGDAMVVGLSLALVFASGDPFMAPLAALIAAALCWAARPDLRHLLKGVVVAGATAVGLLAPLLVETRAFLPLSERAPPLVMSPYEALSFSTPPARLLELVSQFFALTPEARAAVNAGGMNRDDFWYPSLTFGVVVIVLGAIGVGRTRSRSALPVVLGTLLACVLLSFGRWLPAAAWVWEHVPPLSLMRFPERLWRYVVVLGLPLVGDGLVAVAAPAARRAATVTVLVVLAGLTELLVQSPGPQMAPLPEAPPEFSVLAAAAQAHEVRVSVDLRANTAAPPLRFDTRVYDLPMLNGPDPTGSPVLKYIPAEAWPTHLSLQWLGVSHLIMPVVDDPAPVVATLGLEAATPLGDTGYELRRVATSGPHLGTVLTRVSSGTPFRGLEAGGRPVAAPDGAIATVVPTVDYSRFVSGLRDGDFLIDDRHHLDVGGVLTPAASIPPLDPTCRDHGRAVDLDVAVDLTAIRATLRADCPALLSVPWRFLAGWRATVNGSPRDIVAVNSLTLGVPLDRGDNVVELQWQTPGRSMAWLSALTVALISAMLVLERRRQ